MNVHLPKPLFTRPELWYHVLMMPVLFPVGNYLFLHERYFTDPIVFAWGTGLVFGLYWLSLVILTVVVKRIIQQYPDARQVGQRTVMALLAVTTLTVGLAVFDVWMYSLFPIFNRPFDWGTVRAIGSLGVVFDLLLCFVLGIQYTYGRWQENQTEKEQLKRAGLQQDFDALKQQINPSFLFTSLNSLSALIGQDQQRAGVFVDHLSNVYRYLLGMAHQPLTTLGTELAFINSYGYLLSTRYQSAISLTISVDPARQSATLPPLSGQRLLDYAIRHNVVSVAKPLRIRIDTTPAGELRMQYNRQPRSGRFRADTDELTTLQAKYAGLSGPPVAVLADDLCFTITLPLLAESTVFTA